MADIQMMRSYTLPIAVAKARVRQAADELAAEYDLTNTWSGNRLRFERSGLHGEVHVGASEIHLQAHLSPLLRPLKGKLVTRIEEKFERLFPEHKIAAHAPRRHGKTETAGSR